MRKHGRGDVGVGGGGGVKKKRQEGKTNNFYHDSNIEMPPCQNSLKSFYKRFD